MHKKTQETFDLQTIEHIYLHVPFCSSLCHYCDFAKTANFTTDLTAAYFKRLAEHLELWLRTWRLQLVHHPQPDLRTLYIGGGTPSLFTAAYATLFESIAPFLQVDCEITLEANPQDISKENLLYWQELGINRLSIGVQTFAADSLRFLQRQHSAKQAFSALELAVQYFTGNISVDLIYGMQSAAEWQQDLRNITTFPLQHVSCYNLTYEPRTPLGRAAARGKIQVIAADPAAEMYQQAVETLASENYEHYEVSNWGKQRSQHNLCYWQDKSYIGIGSGAHGYLADPHAEGKRYSYTTNERKFTRLPVSDGSPLHLSALTVDQRDTADWLLEYLATGLRCVEGVSLSCIAAKSNRRWQPTATVQEAISRGQLSIDSAQQLQLAQAEWLREQSWVLALLDSFVCD